MKNKLKEKLRNGEVTYGISVGTPSNDIVELVSTWPSTGSGSMANTAR